MSQRKHILIVITGISAGTGTIVKSLGDGLRRWYGSEFKVSLLTFNPDANRPGNAEHFDETFSLSTTVQAGWKQALLIPSLALRLRKCVARIQPDLVMTVGTFANLLGDWALRDVPIVLSDHLNLSERLASRRSPFGRVMLRRIYTRHAAIGVSEAVTADLREHFGATDATTLPNGVDIERIETLAGKEPPKLPARFIVSVGRLVEQKDPRTLLDAFALARRAGLTEDLVYVGCGLLEASLRARVRELSLEQSVQFLGQLDNPFPVMRAARCLVMSSIYEGFGLVLLEAMSLGVPCISTDCPSGPAEVLGKGRFGLLVPPRNPAALSAALVNLCSDDALHQQLSAASITRSRELSLERMTRAYRDLFDRVLKNPAKA